MSPRPAALLALFLAAPAAPQEEAEVRPRPNIVLILADDLGHGDLRAYNRDSKIPTHHMDRLASEGLRLTDAHSPSAVCTPTRYGLLTGRYPWRTRLQAGVLDGESPCLLEPGRTTLASLVKAAGYATACIGKWHLGLGAGTKTDYSKPLRPGPLDFGFDRFFGIPASLDMQPYLYVEGDRPVAPATGEIEAGRQRRDGGEGFWRRGGIAEGFRHADVLDRITTEAVGWIEERAQEDAPFFLYFALTAPHTPWLPAEEFEGRSGAGPYGDFCLHVDHSVGRVLAVLDRLELADDTLVILTSDNGAHWTVPDIQRTKHLANGLCRGQKADIWEGGHRVPLIVRWPGRVPAGKTSDETVCQTDFLATFASLLGVELGDGEGEDSWDLTPLLMGREYERPLREATVHQSMTGFLALRKGRWKMIPHCGSGGFSPPQTYDPKAGEPEGQLYDLGDTVHEGHNRWLEQPEVVDEMLELLERYRVLGRSRP